MAARAFLWTTVLEVDSVARRVVFTPSRWFGALFAPAFAFTPVALLWIEQQGIYQLTGGGWIIAIGYAVIAVVSAVMFLSPQNRYVAFDLAKGQLVLGGPWGIGPPLEEALANVPIAYTETARQNQGNTIYSGKLFATVRGRRYLVAHLANKAIDVVRILAHLVPRAVTGEDVDLQALERVVAENARGAVLRAVGIALLVVVPGVMYAVSYAHR